MVHGPLEGGGAEALPHSPAAERNAGAILDVLLRVLPAQGRVLEIASGTGQHAVHFAAAMPALRWQPTDGDPGLVAAIDARVQSAGRDNLERARTLDVGSGRWPVEPADAIVCSNLLHVAPWEVTSGLMSGTGRTLATAGPLVVYGPFRIGGVHTAASNERFDRDLQARHPRWGIRDIADVAAVAEAAGLDHTETIPMPANNRLLVFRRR